jgi:hypothetical protein
MKDINEKVDRKIKDAGVDGENVFVAKDGTQFEQICRSGKFSITAIKNPENEKLQFVLKKSWPPKGVSAGKWPSQKITVFEHEKHDLIDVVQAFTRYFYG